MTTLLALYRRPDGGPDAIAEFERRYTDEHLPLVEDSLGRFCELGLMVSEDGQYLSLALPVNANW